MNIRKITAFIFFTTLLTFNGFAQLAPVTVCLGVDATVCQGQSVVINNCGTGGGSGALNMNAPVSVSLSDDSWSSAVPIGFTFNYYGVNYTQCVIGSNGLVSFKLSNASGYCPWSLNGTSIPSTAIAGASNSAMGVYTDMNPSNTSSGPVQYQTLGTAPNRVFVVLYKGVTAFSCTSSCSYVAFLFYEGTNVIEYHIGSKQVCPGWNGGLAIQGVQNLAGNLGTASPGRNNTVWTALQDGKRFNPTSASNTNAYTVTTIPYVNVTSSGSTGSGLQWQSTLNQTFPYNGGALTIATVPAGTTGYFLTGTSCGVSMGSVSDTSFITRTSATVTTTSIADTCGVGSGSVTAIPGSGTNPFTYNWAALGATTATVNNVSAGTYTVNANDANGCPATSTVTVTNVPSTTTDTSTLVSCPGDADGTATATMLPLGSSTTYQWDDPAAQTTQTAVGLSAGTYNCTITSSNGCVEVVTVTVSEIPGMIGTITNKQDVTCYTGNDGIIDLNVVAGTAPYSFSWSGSSSITSSANDLYVGPQQIDITDSNGCLITINTILDEPMPLVIDSVSMDTMICSESTIILGAVGGGGSSPYIYTWYEDGVQFSTDQNPLVDPLNSGTIYQVVLSEQCGSPTTSSSLTITFPTPIQPLVVPNPIQACAPDTFKFVNASTNNSDIATTFYEFSNGSNQMLNGLDTASQLFKVANAYDVNMTITSIYGCIYNDYFPSIITALKRPKAQFGMSSNPTTIFETRVKMFDKSVDAVAWQWIAAQASPAASSIQNPEFNFPQVEGLYPVFLTVTSSLGCWDTLTVMLDIQSDILFYAPNSFTPDNDEHNPTWKFSVAGMDLSNFELSVYNRWGEVIWQTFDANAEWDGTYKGQLVDSGMYNWKARFKKFGKEDYQIKTGNVNIIR
jgi:gliding motility-associated-like protein